MLWHCRLGIRKSIRPVKNWVMRCLCGYLSGVRCRLFACSSWCHGIPKPHNLLPHLNPDWFYLSGTGWPRLSWKRGCEMGVVVVPCSVWLANCRWSWPLISANWKVRPVNQIVWFALFAPVLNWCYRIGTRPALHHGSTPHLLSRWHLIKQATYLHVHNNMQKNCCCILDY